jgi:hypothetical protein
MSFSRVRSHYQPRRHLHAQVVSDIIPRKYKLAMLMVSMQHLQQRINRIRRRLSRFVGREPTPDAVLRKYILERVARHSPSQTYVPIL